MHTIIKQAIGDWPIVVSMNNMEHRDICESLGLNPHRMGHSTARTLEGCRPTSIIYGPSWSRHPDAFEIGLVIARLRAKSPAQVPEFYLTDEDLRG